jgi:pyruvate dehydrogenase E2 component (dihydrolipoamide acetyltransferase)
MADVIMPQMGESIAEGTVTRWMKNVGDTVERDEPLFEISTDKVDAEIPSPAAGVLREIRVPPGTTVEVNSVVGVIEDEGEATIEAPPVEPAEAPAAEPSPPPATSAPPPPEAPPTPSSPEPPAAEPPTVPPAESGPIPPVEYRIEGEAPPPPPEPATDRPRAELTPEELRQVRSSPVVRRIAAEHELDLAEIAGTGIGGRVTKQDILGHIEAGDAARPGRAAPAASPGPEGTPPPAAPPQAEAPPVADAAPTTAPTPAAAGSGKRIEIVPMSPIRRKTAEHMILSKRTSAHVSTVFEIDMTRVDQLRRKHAPGWEEKSGVRLTYLPFILKAVIDALKVFPILNARIDGESVVYHRDVNLGVAVALDRGLIVPVIHHADEKNLLGLARAVVDLAERARGKKLQVDEVQGGTFTITNPGVFGSLFGTPIINQPQAAILGVGTIEKRPVVRDDAIAIRTMAYFALTFDHRLVDGADADRFMAHIKTTLQEFDDDL